MKLGILCTIINGFGRRGFYNTQEIGLGRALARKGHTVTVYKCQKKTKDAEPETVEVEPGLTVHYLPIGNFGVHGYLDTSVLPKNLDGLLCFSDNQIFLPHVYRYCKHNGICLVPYVGTTFSVHGGMHAKAIAVLAKPTMHLYKGIRVIAKTEGAKKELEALGIHKISVANVGLDTAILKQDYQDQDRTALREKFGFSAADTVLFSVARMEPDKRPLDLIDTFHKIKLRRPECKLIVVGEGYLRPEVDAKIEGYGLTEDVKILNRVPYADMWELYTMADYFLNMNVEEIFGMAVMEAVYYQASVAARVAPGPSITLKNMPGHKLCDTDDDVVEWVCGAYPDAETLAASSKKMITDFSWDHCADTYVQTVQRSRAWRLKRMRKQHERNKE